MEKLKEFEELKEAENKWKKKKKKKSCVDFTLYSCNDAE